MSMITAGIDVAAKSLMVDVLCDGEKARSSKPWAVDNTPAGHARLIKKLRAMKIDRVVCEATGVYHLDMAMALVRAQLPLMVANPRQVKCFIQARLRNAQSDPVDAHELAQFGFRMAFVPWQAPASTHYALHRIARCLHGYVDQGVAAKNRLHAANATLGTPAIIIKSLKRQLVFLEKLEAELRDAAIKIVAENTQLTRHFALLVSVPGIAETSAIRLLGELCVMPEGLSAKAWVKCVGLDPTSKQSGTSVKTKAHISKRGNAHLRGALYMPAMSARRHDPGLKFFADRLVANGKTKMQAVIAVARKLLHGIHAMTTLNQPWNSTALVPMPPKMA